LLRIIMVALVAGLAGAGAGAFGWYAFGPLLQTRAVNEPLPPEFSGSVLARGQFRDADARHRGRGTVRLMQTALGTRFLRFEQFEVTNGPDLKVWLVAAKNIRSAADVTSARVLELGFLKGNRGDQTYVLPHGTDVSGFDSVVVWCEAFGVLFSPADLAGP
jgi:hypothetical protein